MTDLQRIRFSICCIMAVVFVLALLACIKEQVQTPQAYFTGGFKFYPAHPLKSVEVKNIYKEDDKNPEDCLFDNPAGAALSMDGKYLFISNSAAHNNNQKDFGWIKDKGFVTRLQKTQAGWEAQDCKLLTGALEQPLTAPLGMATLKWASGPQGIFKKGAIFVADGSMPMTDSSGNPIKKLNLARIVAFNPNLSSKPPKPNDIYGQIKLGPGSNFEKTTGHTVHTPNGLAFDKHGNLYLTDTAFTSSPTSSGVWKIPFKSLEHLAAANVPLPPDGKPTFIEIHGHPWGLWVKGEEIWVGTIGNADPQLGGDPRNGALYRLSEADFASGAQPEPVHRDLGALMGMCFIENTMLVAEIKRHPPSTSILMLPNGGQGPVSILGLPPLPNKLNELTNSGHMAVEHLNSGNRLLVVPELNQIGGPPPDHVTFIELPAKFSAP